MGCQEHRAEHCEGHGKSRVPGSWRSPRTGTLLLQLQKHPHPNDKEIWYVGVKGRYVHRLMTGRNREKGCVPYRTESDPEQKSQRTAGLLIPKSQIGLNHFSGGRGREGGNGARPGTWCSCIYFHVQENSRVCRKCPQPTDGEACNGR